MDDDFYLKADDFFKRCLPAGLTFDTLLWQPATRNRSARSSSRNLLVRGTKLSIPILSSDMDTVTSRKWPLQWLFAEESA